MNSIYIYIVLCIHSVFIIICRVLYMHVYDVYDIDILYMYIYCTWVLYVDIVYMCIIYSVYVYIYIYTHLHMHIHMYMYIYIYIYICIYIYYIYQCHAFDYIYILHYIVSYTTVLNKSLMVRAPVWYETLTVVWDAPRSRPGSATLWCCSWLGSGPWHRTGETFNWRNDRNCGYPLVMTNIAIENHNF